MPVGRGPIGQIVHFAGVPGGQPIGEPLVPAGSTAGQAPAIAKPKRRASAFSSAVSVSGCADAGGADEGCADGGMGPF